MSKAGARARPAQRWRRGGGGGVIGWGAAAPPPARARTSCSALRSVVGGGRDIGASAVACGRVQPAVNPREGRLPAPESTATWRNQTWK
ncbi:Protein of unknown function [Gryllus bimaculatus]|nr:Protein of unknown function [Gryllus bimaculatus]